MIINVRGGSGAGKSTVIRKVMEQFPLVTPHYIEGRRQPLWYDCGGPGVLRTLRVLGHYETPCGGCDTISKNPSDKEEPAMGFIHRLVREADEAGVDVLYEGVILTTILGELPELHKEGRDLLVVNLTSDLETCLMGISARRLEKEVAKVGEGSTAAEIRAGLAEKTISNNIGKLRSAMKTASQLRSLGVRVEDSDREQAVALITRELAL